MLAGVFWEEKYMQGALGMNKDARVLPFQLNKAQLYLDSRIEDQKQRTGKVRIVVLKGRQQGCL